MSTKTFNVLLAVTGSVATVKLIELTKKIKSMFPLLYTDKPYGTSFVSTIKIKIIMTKNSKHFISKDCLIENLNDPSNIIEILDDDDEWSSWKKMGDPVLHIELRKWADLCLIAPLDANTMAKIANGICDNLLTCVIRAWDISKPLLYCPAMNVHMYEHPITQEQLSRLQSFGYIQIDCVEKKLACGDVGMGGMASIEDIANNVIDCLKRRVATNSSGGSWQQHDQQNSPSHSDDIDSTNLYIANLPPNMNELELEEYLSTYGTVLSTRILRNQSNNSRRVGFARMESRDKCEEIIEQLNGKVILYNDLQWQPKTTPNGVVITSGQVYKTTTLIVKFADASDKKSKKSTQTPAP